VGYIVGSLYILYALGVLSLIWNLVQSARLVRRQRALPPAGAGSQRSSLDVVIPVKDEERNIRTCIESVLSQDHPATKIIVVNDRSTDGTAQAVQAIQDHHPQLCRVDITELPPGLYGKPHAIHTIASELKSEYVAFVDSDLRLNPACLGTLVHHLEAENLDWVAVMGAPEVTRFWERVIVPIFGAVIFAWYDPRKISDPKWPNAIGSALMVGRRTAYEAIGGHGAVINIYDEDSELVRIAKRAGQRISFVLTPELFTQRHYGGLAATIRGMTRTFVGGLKTIPRLLFTAGSLAFITLLPLAILILVPAAAASGRPVMWERLWWATAVVHLHMSIILSFLVYHTAGVPRRLALLHPVGVSIMIYVCFRSMLHMLRGESIAWRGTKY
jgi:chlorobactene glucosyltransferase